MRGQHREAAKGNATQHNGGGGCGRRREAKSQ